ncbi:MAG TPA: CBS domain-containing protein [Rhodocyclaceae bacterium]|nr:CBS domain-containing protein [Rhodocyclaceae bacterium]
MVFKHLPISKAPSRASLLARIAGENGVRVDAADPAVSVMVDFARECPLTVGLERHIDDALQDMIKGGVRTLLVLDEGHVVGLITAYDIQGERPLQFLQSSDCVHESCLHKDITVADIMTPLEQLPVLDLRDVSAARVGDLLETFKATAQTHLVVVEGTSGSSMQVRGLISCARLERQLGADPGSVPRHRIEREMTLLDAAMMSR